MAIAITLLVLVSALFPVDAVRDAATLLPVGEGRLVAPTAYLSLEPISSVLDTITLLSIGQHIALFVWVVVGFALWRAVRARQRPTAVRRELIAALLLLVAVVLTYVAAAVAPRPMAQFVMSDETVIAIDFHSHTKYSHDGRPGWSEDDVRAWHRGGGYDVAYITDHRTFEGAERAIAGNPAQAGEGTMLLQGLEVVYRGEHVNILSAGRRYRGLTTPDLRDMDDQSLAIANVIPSTAPVVIETLPGDLGKIPATTSQGTPAIAAIEVVDGAPRGLSQSRRERARIVRIADSLNLALVVGSDNHGWGRTAPGWTLIRITGWRGMATDSMSRRIEEILRVGRRQATRAVERIVAGGTSPISLLFAGPAIAWRMFTTLSADERVMWLVWTWGLVLIARGVRNYRVRPSATA